MGAKASESFPRSGDTVQEDPFGLEWRAGSKALVQTRLFCNPIGQPKAVWACNVGSAGAHSTDQHDDAGAELFREFAVAPEDIFGDDVHIPDVSEEVVEDNGFVFDQAAQQSKGSPAQTTSSLTFGWWHTQEDKDADSVSVGREERPNAHGDVATDEATATAIPRLPHGNSAGPVQSSGTGNAGQKDDGKHSKVEGDELLEPLPGSPGGLAPADLLDNEIPRAPVHARPADAMPLTQAPDMLMGPSQDAFASQDTPEKGPHPSSGSHGAGRSQASAQKTTMFGKGLRAVFSPFRGIFGDKGKGDSQKGSSQAEGSHPVASNPQHKSDVPATPLSPSQGGTGTMADLRDSPRAADVRQGLDMIEHAHRLGGAKFKSASGASSGPGEKAASAGAAAGLTDAHPLGVDEAGGPVTTTGAVTGQTVSTEAAEEAASHRVVAPSGVPGGEDSNAMAPLLAPEAAAQQQAPVAAKPSRKRMAPGADAPGITPATQQAEGAGVGAPENRPRKQKRRLATGMDVVRRILGLKDPKAPRSSTG